MDFLQSHKFLRYLWLYVITVGFLFIFIIPPFQKTDEISHYYKTVSVAQGNLNCVSSSSGQGYNLIPKSLHELPDKMMTGFVNQDRQHRFPKAALGSVLKVGFDSSLVVETAPCSLPFVFYLPAAIVLAIPIFLKANPLVIFYLGRLSFYLFSLLIFHLSLRVIPKKFQLVILSCMSLPMVLIQMSSFNKEVFHISFGILTFALFLSLRHYFTIKGVVLFIFSMLLFILPRPQYLPFFLLLLIIFQKQLKSKLIVYSGIILGVAGLAASAIFAVIFFIPKIRMMDSPAFNNNGVFPYLQILFIKLFPLKFLSVLLNSYTNHIDAYYKSFIGTFGGIHYYLDWYVYAFYGIFLLSVIYSYSKSLALFNRREILEFAFMVMASTLLIFVSLYLYATPVGFTYVIDVQGRYFIMMLPYVIIITAAILKKFGSRIIYFGFALVIVFLLKNVYDRYFDYSKAYYYDLASYRNTELLSINYAESGEMNADPYKKLVGLHFFVETANPMMTGRPFLVNIYHNDCRTLLSKTLLTNYIRELNFRDAIFDRPLSGISSFCYTLVPLGKTTFDDGTYFYVYGDKSTGKPIALPIYAF